MQQGSTIHGGMCRRGQDGRVVQGARHGADTWAWCIVGVHRRGMACDESEALNGVGGQGGGLEGNEERDSGLLWQWLAHPVSNTQLVYCTHGLIAARPGLPSPYTTTTRPDRGGVDWGRQLRA